MVGSRLLRLAGFGRESVSVKRFSPLFIMACFSSVTKFFGVEFEDTPQFLLLKPLQYPSSSETLVRNWLSECYVSVKFEPVDFQLEWSKLLENKSGVATSSSIGLNKLQQ